MMLALLTLLVGCNSGTLQPEDSGDTAETEDTDTPSERWEATFWELQQGHWISTHAFLDQRVTGLELDTYAETLTAAGGKRLWQWSDTAWVAMDMDEAPGPIDAYDASYTDVRIAVDDRLYTWTENPGVWARWGEKAPGTITGLIASYGGQGTRVAVGDQLYTLTEEEEWVPWEQPAPGEIQCLCTSYQRILVGVDGTLYELIDEQGWVATDLPAAPESTLSACALATTYEEGEPVEHHLLATVRQTR